jgi:hypothetical protein
MKICPKAHQLTTLTYPWYLWINKNETYFHVDGWVKILSSIGLVDSIDTWT